MKKQLVTWIDYLHIKKKYFYNYLYGIKKIRFVNDFILFEQIISFSGWLGNDNFKQIDKQWYYL